MADDVRLDSVKTSPEATIREVIEVVDRSNMAVALMVDIEDRLVGLLTDGDVRRALLHGASLDDPAHPHATLTPQTVGPRSPRALVLDVMRALRISAVPEVDHDGRLVGLHTLSDVVGRPSRPNQAVVMAGGRGTRLGELARVIPKPLVEVAGRSVIDWVLLGLVGAGIRDITITVNHLADLVIDHVGNGDRLGCRISYVREENSRPLGTAGSLAMFRRDRPYISEPVLVMNADLMVQFDAGPLLDFHSETKAAVTVAARPYQHHVPFGVLESDACSRLRGISEKPVISTTVNAGIYVVSAEVLDRVASDTASTMPDLIAACLTDGLDVRVWNLGSEWIDIGTPQDLARANGGW